MTSPLGERDQCASKAHLESNPKPVVSNTSNAKREILELEAMKKQEEIDEQLVLKRKFEKELAIAEIEKENARAKRTADKEMEIAQAERSRASTRLRSVSPIPIQNDTVEKVHSYPAQIKFDGKLTQDANEVCRITQHNNSNQWHRWHSKP